MSKLMNVNGKGEKVFRQGDVLIVPVKWETGEWNYNSGRLERTKKGLILAAGEATGHHHVVKGRNVRQARRMGKDIVLIGKSGASVTHEEHDSIALAPGAYEIRRQREYSPPMVSQNTEREWSYVAD